MSAFDSIVVGNDLVSEHWLAEQFPATVKTLRTAWTEREGYGKETPRSGLRALATGHSFCDRTRHVTRTHIAVPPPPSRGGSSLLTLHSLNAWPIYKYTPYIKMAKPAGFVRMSCTRARVLRMGSSRSVRIGPPQQRST